jgi:hypothetical protein
MILLYIIWYLIPEWNGQSTLIEMHDILWLYDPSLSSSLRSHETEKVRGDPHESAPPLKPCDLTRDLPLGIFIAVPACR